MGKIFRGISIFVFCNIGVAWARTAQKPIAPNVIYGDDDRKEIFQVDDIQMRNIARSTALLIKKDNLVDANAEEYSVVASTFGEEFNLCSEEPFREQLSSGFCSGFLVAPNKIATAGHCITSQSRCDKTKFVMGYGYEQEASDMRNVSKSAVYSCKRILARKEDDQGADYALIELDRPVLDRNPIPLADSKPQNGEGLTVIGHPSGLPSKIGIGQVRSSTPVDYIVSNLDTYGGNSGSAVLRSSDHSVVGILVRGEMDFISKGGCSVSYRCSSEGCRGEDVTRIDFIKKALTHKL